MEAEAHGDEDKQKKESAEAKNIAEQMLYTAEKSLKDFKDKIPADVAKGVEEKIEAVKKLKDSTDVVAIKNATEELSKEMQKIGEYMKNQTNSAQDTSKTGEEKKDDKGGEGNVREAETK
jgi:molecular chaperone DnaK